MDDVTFIQKGILFHCDFFASFSFLPFCNARIMEHNHLGKGIESNHCKVLGQMTTHVGVVKQRLSLRRQRLGHLDIGSHMI
jgi:hypothetical protein